MKNSKSIIITLAIVAFLALVVIVFSVNNNQNNEEVPGDENYTKLELKHMTEDDIEEPKDGKLNVYFFWGSGCPHCEKLMQALNDGVKTYGKYYNLYTLEVWENDSNYSLMKKVAKHFGDDKDLGLPYIIIGDQRFSGFMYSDKDDIEKAIVDEYNSKPQFNIFDELY